MIKNEECPDELRGPVFDERGIVLGTGLPTSEGEARRLCSAALRPLGPTTRLVPHAASGDLKQLAEQVLLSCPAYKADLAPIFIPGELTTIRWGFAFAVSAYCSHRRRVKRSDNAARLR